MGTIAFRVSLLASALCILAGVVGLYAGSAILDRGEFADRAVAAIAQDEVSEEIAQRHTDATVDGSPGLVTLRPALESAAEDVATSPQFAARFGAAMRSLHREIFAGGAARPSLHVPGMSAQVQDALAERTPALATRLPRDADPSLMSIGGTVRERALLRVARHADTAGAAAPILLVLGLAGLALTALTAPDRRRALWACGLAAAVAGGVLAAGWIAARTLTLEGFDTSWGDAVVSSIWSAYLDDLRTWALGLAGAGIVLAAAARPAGARLPSLASVPGGARGAAALVAGAVLLADRELALDLAAAAGAGLLLYAGASRLLEGRGRVPLATAALVLVAATMAVATRGPAPAPAVVRTQPAAKAVAATAADRRPEARDGARICFASMQDARAAAETAAIPEGAVIKALPDGRVCAGRADAHSYVTRER